MVAADSRMRRLLLPCLTLPLLLTFILLSALTDATRMRQQRRSSPSSPTPTHSKYHLPRIVDDAALLYDDDSHQHPYSIAQDYIAGYAHDDHAFDLSEEEEDVRMLQFIEIMNEMRQIPKGVQRNAKSNEKADGEFHRE